MKLKNIISNNITQYILMYVFFVILLPFALLFLVGCILYTPIDYVKFKRSAYQKDFPTKYKWLWSIHTDNDVYTIIKENNLPISYLRFQGYYESAGYFLYKDVSLNFFKPFFFDEEKEEWLFLPDNEDDCEIGESSDDESENTVDCITEEESREYILGQFHEQYPNVVCIQTVFFYENKFVKSMYGDLALEKMKQNDSFILYDKGSLKEAIQKFISETDTKH